MERNALVQELDFPGLLSTSYWGGIADAGLYRPLTLLSFGLNRALGASASGFHLANDLLHGVAAVLVLLLARGLGFSTSGSIASGLLFALHPVQTEAVNAIVGRAEILAFTFAIASLLLFRRGASPFLVGGLFFLALASKESAAFALPLFLLERRDPKKLVPLGAAALSYAVLRIAALGGFGIAGREIGFLDNPLAVAGLGTRLLAAPVLVLQTVKLVVWPSTLSADYSFDQIPIPRSPMDARVVGGVAVLGVAALLAARRRELRLPLFAFFVPLAGFLHILFPLGTIFAERLLYLPLLGAALSFGWTIEALMRRKAWIGGMVLVPVLVLSSLRVWFRHGDWRDNETLFRRTVATAPSSARSHFLLGAELLEKEKFAEAARSFEKGLSIYPAHLGARMSLGEALLAAGDARGAEEQFRRALEIAPGSEDLRRAAAGAALAEGRARARAGELEEAGKAFERATALDESDPEARNYLGLVLERRDRLEDARRQYERALELDPDHLGALLNLGSVRMNLGELAGAEEAFRRALELAPDSYEAYNGLGITLARGGRREEAAAAFERAIELRPELETARENLRALKSR